MQRNDQKSEEHKNQVRVSGRTEENKDLETVVGKLTTTKDQQNIPNERDQEL